MSQEIILIDMHQWYISIGKQNTFCINECRRDWNPLEIFEFVYVSQLSFPSLVTKKYLNHNSSACMDNGSLDTKRQYEGITKSLQKPTQTHLEAIHL